jgi:hypothetical protein
MCLSSVVWMDILSLLFCTPLYVHVYCVYLYVLHSVCYYDSISLDQWDVKIYLIELNLQCYTGNLVWGNFKSSL